MMIMKATAATIHHTNEFLPVQLNCICLSSLLMRIHKLYSLARSLARVHTQALTHANTSLFNGWQQTMLNASCKIRKSERKLQVDGWLFSKLIGRNHKFTFCTYPRFSCDYSFTCVCTLCDLHSFALSLFDSRLFEFGCFLFQFRNRQIHHPKPIKKRQIKKEWRFVMNGRERTRVTNAKER